MSLHSFRILSRQRRREISYGLIIAARVEEVGLTLTTPLDIGTSGTGMEVAQVAFAFSTESAFTATDKLQTRSFKPIKSRCSWNYMHSHSFKTKS